MSKWRPDVYPVSSDFKQQVRQSHRSVIRAEVWRGETSVLELEPISGSVEVDARRGVRRTCQVTLAAPEPTVVLDWQMSTYLQLAQAWTTYGEMATSVATYGQLPVAESSLSSEVDSGIVPGSEGDALAPFGNELRLWRGITVPVLVADQTTYGELSGSVADYGDLTSGSPSYAALNVITATTVESDELVPLGVFLITEVAVDDGQGGVRVTVTGSDRSRRISRNRWTEPYTVQAGNVATAIQALLEDRWDDVVCNFTDTTTTIGQAVLGLETSNDPWADAVKIALDAGLDLFFDGDGIARLEPVRDYSDASADATYLQDEEAMVLGLSRKLSSERTYNGVIVHGEGSQAPAVFRGEAWDDDPASPTYRHGPFGQVPMFYASPLMVSDDMCNKAAMTILAKKRGVQESVEWSQIVDPSLDAGDVIGVFNTAAKVNRVLVLDRVTIPLGAAEQMRAVARAVRSLGATGFDEEQ